MYNQFFNVNKIKHVTTNTHSRIEQVQWNERIDLEHRRASNNSQGPKNLYQRKRVVHKSTQLLRR